MKFLEVKGKDQDFGVLCKKLEDYQYAMLPGIKEKGYSLTDDLDDVEVVFLLYIDNRAVGSIGLKRKSIDTCEIVRVFVEEDFRGQGYSKMLFDRIESRAKQMGFKNAEIVAWCKAETAVKLYEKRGYQKSEEKISEWFGGYRYVEFFKNF